jgi:hypothetical protein
MNEQILLADASDGTSVMSSVTNPSISTPSTAGRSRGCSNVNGVILIIDVPCLTAGSPLKKMMPITIQSMLPHIILQFGPDMDTADCPLICCTVDTCGALTTDNFHFFSAVAKHYPHCIAKILAPADYKPIVLSGTVQNKDKAVTTKLEVGFQFHLPYWTSGGDASSLLIATGPHVLVNTIIGLPFIKATGMILGFVVDIAECNHLDCPPFAIDYRRTSNHVPTITDNLSMSVHHVSCHVEMVLNELENLKRWFNGKVQAGSTQPKSAFVYFGSMSPCRAHASETDGDSMMTSPDRGIDKRWVPPTSMPPGDSSDDYHHQILREDGYL